MKNIVILLILLVFIQPIMAKKSGIGRDPFNAVVQTQTEDKTIIDEEMQTLPLSSPELNCVSDQTVIAQTISFHQLFIIGVIQQNNSGKVLFKDPQNNVFIASLGDFIGKEQMKLHQINPKTLAFLSWDLNCSTSSPIIVDF